MRVISGVELLSRLWRMMCKCELEYQPHMSTSISLRVLPLDGRSLDKQNMD